MKGRPPDYLAYSFISSGKLEAAVAPVVKALSDGMAALYNNHRNDASAIPVSQFQAEVKKLAEHGRVLVLLDACHSCAVAGDGSVLAPNADLLRSVIASGQRDGADIIQR